MDSIKRCPPLSSTFLFLRIVAAVLTLGPDPGHAQATASGRASYLPPSGLVQPEAPPINPTGRVLEMTVPLSYRVFYLGDLSVRLTPQQTVEVLVADLGQAVKELLRPEALQALDVTGSDAEYVSLSTLRAAGFDFRFDPTAVSIIFTPTLDQKVEGNISVQARKAAQDSPNAVDPAKLAAFVNMRAATDYIGVSPSGMKG